ncbi:F-box only protein 6-like [Mya arenaria]|uniref:F-box only protein 6-like n=1 Tax=Mya arenaria TaxID=6604 RepID=UPI0022E6E7B3|nr:F-box only protein 6-like [Mya arenaria]
MGVASSSKPSDSHKWVQILNNFPDDILFEILLRVPTRDLVKSCVYVCKQWHDTIASRSFWKEKCIQDRIFSQHCWDHLGNRDENYKRLYIKHPYERNLIKNPDASKELSEWQVVYNGGNGWRMETEPIGSDPVSRFNDECKGTVGCWVSSYGKCAKYQVVDLMAAGCSEYVLDHIRPAIHVSEWYAARFDCGAVYKMKVVLLSEKTGEFWSASSKDTNCRYSFKETLPSGRAWFQAKHTFTDYPTGIRYVGFYHEGKDTQFWAGHFGAKMTLASVILDFSHVAGLADSCDGGSKQS